MIPKKLIPEVIHEITEHILYCENPVCTQCQAYLHTILMKREKEKEE